MRWPICKFGGRQVRGTGYGNTPQLLGVLTADSPAGPFTFVSNKTGSDDPFHTVAPGIKNLPSGYQYADATLYQDPSTHRTYVYWRTRMTNGLDGKRACRFSESSRAAGLQVTSVSSLRALSTYSLSLYIYVYVQILYVYDACPLTAAHDDSSRTHHAFPSHCYTQSKAQLAFGVWN